MAGQKITRGTKFESLTEVRASLPENHAVVLYRPKAESQFVAYDDSGDFFHPFQRKCLDDNLAGARNFDPNAFKVFRAKVSGG